MEKDSSSWGVLPKHPPCSLDSLHSTQKEPGTLLMPLDGCSIPTARLWGSMRCARAASPWGPAEILVLPAQGCCQWDLLSNPWLMSSAGGLTIKLALPWRSPGNKKSSQDGQVSELTPRRCCRSLAFNCFPGMAFIPHGLRR